MYIHGDIPGFSMGVATGAVAEPLGVGIPEPKETLTVSGNDSVSSP